jgi:hypothetical protein
MNGQVYDVRRDEYGYAVAITCAGWDVLHLVQGSVRNEQEVDALVAALNRIGELERDRDALLDIAHPFTVEELEIYERIVGRRLAELGP